MIPAGAEFSWAEGSFFAEDAGKVELVFETGDFGTLFDGGVGVFFPVIFGGTEAAFDEEIFETGVVFVPQKLSYAGDTFAQHVGYIGQIDIFLIVFIDIFVDGGFQGVGLEERQFPGGDIIYEDLQSADEIFQPLFGELGQLGKFELEFSLFFFGFAVTQGTGRNRIAGAELPDHEKSGEAVADDHRRDYLPQTGVADIGEGL